MSYSPLINQLIDSLRYLPGVGPKAAQRMAFHLLQRNKQGGLQLAKVLQQAIEQVRHCQLCRMLCEQTICSTCSNPKRDASKLCVIEMPADVIAIERTRSYQGLYFVLMGHLSPIDGVGPAAIGMPSLQQRLQENNINELILATNATVEGEATAHYIAELAKKFQVKTSRIAYGVPLGGELEFVDVGTLTRALQGRDIY